MKYAILVAAFLASSALRAGGNQKTVPERPAPENSSRTLIEQCPRDMPVACACIEHGNGVKIVPAIDAYKSGAKVLQVGPRQAK